MSADTPMSHDSALGRLTEELRRILADGSEPDVEVLARRFDVSADEVERCRAALEALGEAVEESLAAGSDDLPPPDLPDDYEILGEIGRGGMAVVYRARQRSLGRSVAVKVLRPGEIVFGEFQQRLLREAKALARLRHPHIVSVHEVGETGGNVFFTMDLVEGTSLAGLIESGELTPTQAVKLLRQVASAVAYSHGQGLVHRDLKPANILVDESGDAFVVDFGLARDLAVKGDLTVTGQLLGTPYYMSPEQARGEADRIGEASDVYALGAVLYECLTGTPPFKGVGGLLETVQAVIHQEPKAPGKLNPKVPRDLEVVCRKAMAKEPERRYATAQALLEDLERFAEGRAIRARPPGVGYRLRRLARRQWRTLLAAGSGVILAAAVLVLFVLPLLGRSVETLFAAAERIRGEGKIVAASQVYEEALREGDWWEPPVAVDPDRRFGDLPGRALLGWAECRLVEGRDLHDRDRPAEAATLFRETLARLESAFGEDVPLPLHGELLWRIVRSRIAAGETTGRPEEIETLTRLVEGLDNESPDGLGVLVRTSAAFEDPSDPAHDVLLPLYSGGPPKEYSPDLPTLFRDLDARRTGLAELVSQLDRHPGATKTVRTLACDLALVCAPELEETLATFAADASKPIYRRGPAAELLCRTADLPLWLGREEPATTFVPRALALWNEVRGLSRVEGSRRRFEHVMDRVVAQGHIPLDGTWTWLRDHGLVARTPVLAECRAWWESSREGTPVAWLRTALKLDRVPTTPEERFRLLRSATGQRLPWAHHLVRLLLPEDTTVPAFAFRDARNSKRWAPAWNLLGAWQLTLLDREAPPPWQIRVAGFHLPDRDAEPNLLWEVVRPVHLDEIVTLRNVSPVRVPRPSAPAVRRDGHRIHPPGLPAFANRRERRRAPEREPERPDTPADESDFHLWGFVRLGVRSFPGYTVLRWSRYGAALVPVGREKENVGGFTDWTNVSEGYVAHAAWTCMLPVDGSDRPFVGLYLATFEPREDGPEPWGAVRWQRSLASNVEMLAGSQPRGGPARDRWDRGAEDLLENALLPALLLEGVPDEATLAKLRRISGYRLGELVKNIEPIVRLGRDDPAAFDELRAVEMGIASRLKPDRVVWHRFWERRLLTTRSPEILAALSSTMEKKPGGWLAMSLGYETVPAHLEADVVRRCRELGAEPPERIRGLAEDAARLPRVRTTLWALGGLAAIALLLGLWPGLDRRARMRPAALLVTLGLVLACNDLTTGGREIPLAAVGLVVAGLGAILLGRTARAFGRFLAAIGFLAAAAALVFTALLSGMEPTQTTIDLLGRASTARTVALLVGLAGLPVLAMALPRPPARPAPVAPRARGRRRRKTISIPGPALPFAIGLVGWALVAIAGSWHPSMHVVRKDMTAVLLGTIGEILALGALLVLGLMLGLAGPRTPPSRRRRRLGRSADSATPDVIDTLVSAPGALVVLAAALVYSDTGEDFMFTQGMAGYAPALWVAMASAVLALVVAAHRGAGVPLLPVRMVRAVRRR